MGFGNGAEAESGFFGGVDSGCAGAAVSRDLALVGARLRTNVSGATTGGDTAILVRAGVIEQLGDDATIRAAAEALDIPIREMNGATVTPGLFDAHTHPHWAADVTAGIDLSEALTIEALQATLAAAAADLPEGAWVKGWNLDYVAFEAEGMRADLIEEAVGGRPTALICYDLHTGLATKAALAAAGIDGPREFADASEIVVDDAGVPTGELREPSAYQLVFDAAPPKSHDEDRDALRDMFRTLAATGLTGGAIMDGKPATIDLLAELEDRGELDHRLTVHHWHAVGDDDAAVERVIAAKDRRGSLWQSGAIKLFSDGVIDTGTAWLHRPDSCGDGKAAFWPDWQRFVDVVRAYHDAGMLIATHAVGDYAVNRVLEVYETLPERPGVPFHSIEHLEVLADEDIAALRNSGVTASMQPLHMQWRKGDNSDSWAVRLGDRAATGYRVRDVLNAGVPLVLGSDWPVAQYDPRLGMAWARGRQMPGQPDAPVFEADQKLTGEEALLAYTLWPAQARGHDDRGVLAPGAVADLTVWAADPVETPATELPEIDIVLTVLDGRVVHAA